MPKKTKMSKAEFTTPVDTSFAAIAAAFDAEIAAEQEEVAPQSVAATSRANAGLSGPPTHYEVALAAALQHMVTWVRLGKFAPTNEEDVQCFLYHALVLELETAIPIHAKPTHSKPETLKFLDERRLVEDMHFPDLIIGSPIEPDAIYVEIKVRKKGRKSFHGLCVADIKKLAKHHSTHRQFFVLFDCDPHTVYLNDKQRADLTKCAAAGCSIWHYPGRLNESPQKAAAERAIAKLRAKGYDFSAAGVQNAKKAIKGKARQA